MVKIQEAERQIVTHYEVYDVRPNDCDLLLPQARYACRTLGPDAASRDRRCGIFLPAQ